MKLVGQIPRPLLGHMASRRGRSALGDEAWDNSSLAFFLSCSQAAEEIRDRSLFKCIFLLPIMRIKLV